MGHSLRHFPENSPKLFYSGQLQCWGGMRGDYLVFSGQALYMFPNMDFLEKANEQIYTSVKGDLWGTP